jgi:hypothetical protein
MFDSLIDRALEFGKVASVSVFISWSAEEVTNQRLAAQLFLLSFDRLVSAGLLGVGTTVRYEAKLASHSECKTNELHVDIKMLFAEKLSPLPR